MFDSIKYKIGRLFEKPYRVHHTTLSSSDHSEAYSEMVSTDLEDKYDGKVFSVPVDLINFDALIQILSEMEHPAIKENVTEPYVIQDFDGLQQDLAEVLTDYMNAHLKLLVNSVMQEYLEQGKIKMSADDDGIKYYTEEIDEDIDAIIRLEQAFRVL